MSQPLANKKIPTLTWDEQKMLEQKSASFAKIIGFLSFIGIILIMAFTIEYDGSKPGGWGYFTGGFSTIIIAICGGIIIGFISFIGSFLTLSKLTLNKKK